MAPVSGVYPHSHLPHAFYMSLAQSSIIQRGLRLASRKVLTPSTWHIHTHTDTHTHTHTDTHTHTHIHTVSPFQSHNIPPCLGSFHFISCSLSLSLSLLSSLFSLSWLSCLSVHISPFWEHFNYLTHLVIEAHSWT